MSRNRLVSRSTFAILACAAALGLAACGSSSAGSAAQPSSSTPTTSGSAPGADLSGVSLRVGQTGVNAAGLALKVAGLDDTPYKVSYSVLAGGNLQLQALQAGALDIANASEIPPVFAAANTKPKWKAVATQKASTLLQEVDVKKGSNIASIVDLKGKKVGYVQATTAQYFLYELLLQNGLKWTDITPVPLQPNAGVAALNGGSIAAFANYGNSVITILQGGGKTVGSGEDILSGNFVYAASNSVLSNEAEKAAAADLFARLNKAFDVIRSDPAKESAYAAGYAEATHQTAASALAQFTAQEKQRKTQFLPVTDTAIASEQKVADAFTALGSVPKVDVASFWSHDLDAALTAALAKYPVAAS